MTLHKAIAAVVITLVGLIIAVVFYVRSIDFDRYRGQLVEELRDATGRDVSINGPIDLVFGLDSAFVIRDVRIGNAPWGSRSELAKIGKVEARFRLLPLLAGQMRIDRLRLIQPDLWLETDPVGKVNWVLAGAPVDRPDAGDVSMSDNGHILGMLGVAGVDLISGRVTYRDGATGAIHVLAFERASVAGDGIANPLSLGLEGSWNGLPLNARGAIGPLDAFLDHGSNTYPVEASITVGGVQVAAKGTVGEIGEGPGIALKFDARADTLQGLEQVLGQGVAAMRRMSLSGAMRYQEQTLAVTDVRFGIGDSSISGEVEVDFGEAKPTFTAKLSAPAVDVSAIFGTPKGEPAMRGSATEHVTGLAATSGLFSQTPWRLPGLNAVNGTAQIHAQSMKVGGIQFQSVFAEVGLQDGTVVVGPFQARLENNELEGRLQIDTRAAPPEVALTIKTSAFAPGPLLQKLDTIKTFDGSLAATAELRARGGDIAALLAALDGEILLAMGRGRLSLDGPATGSLDLAQAGVPGLFGMLVAEDNRDTAIVCAASRISIRNGIATSTGAIIESEFARVTGDGRVDLRAERYDLRFTPRSKGSALVIDRPVVLRGPLQQPTLRVEAKGGRTESGLAAAFRPLRSFFDSFGRDKAQNACLKAVPRKTAKPKRPQRPQEARRPIPSPSRAIPSPAAPPVATPAEDDLNTTE